MYHVKGSSLYVVQLLRSYSVVTDFEVEITPTPRDWYIQFIIKEFVYVGKNYFGGSIGNFQIDL